MEFELIELADLESHKIIDDNASIKEVKVESNLVKEGEEEREEMTASNTVEEEEEEETIKDEVETMMNDEVETEVSEVKLNLRQRIVKVVDFIVIRFVVPLTIFSLFGFYVKRFL
jgi:hypothetical protein